MRKKQLLLIVLALLLILPSFLVGAAPNNSSVSEKSETKNVDGTLASKDEVVYANLSANGNLEEIYVVNTLDVTKAGTIIDYGKYSSIKNLTNLSEIEQTDQTIRINASEGKFYYQGNIKDENELPWDFSISFTLDGDEIAPEELVGKDGHVGISIDTTPNENGELAFFENYLLQVSLLLDPEIYSNIEISDGMIANVGKNKQITFTIMPEQTGELSLKADVIDFELESIEIAAIPSSMSIDTPDIDEMTDDIKTLTNAIEEINNGVAELSSGVIELNNGVSSLRNGSEQYNNGMADINNASSELVQASSSIEKALAEINNNLNVSGEMNFGELHELPNGLTQIANGLNQTANGLTALRENYLVAYNTLQEAIIAIPDYQITETEIQELYMSGTNSAVIDRLVQTYSAAQTAKGTFSSVKTGFDAVDVTLKEVSSSISEMASTLSSIASDLSTSLENMDDLNALNQLQDGLTTLHTNYEGFHSGLVSYTEGISQLSNSYNEIHSGIVEISNGTGELKSGVAELHNGTNDLTEATNDLPDQMQEEIDNMIAEYDKSDFEAVSFVSSSNNDKINAVQFIIKTSSIKKEKVDTSEEHVAEEKTFWTRLVDLFTRN
ncbi:YhgE/Pip domain-containing protein [Bacillus sp. FJAT-45350]|uniref:YhgE/Pip domain-containing protein n=1 Tax=Bacillus sp. FJAT-45350 TaxID=2011014 RepID=UPI0027BA4DDD|nr:YhgE/Pip domain-containing protein [Bacillus sp. FJAT-45350]